MALYFVLFFSPDELEDPPGWRETFLKETLSELGIEYFDTKRHLREHMARTGLTADALYYTANSHLNSLGNAVVATGLTAWLGRRGLGH
jgi:hypothetical protein